MMAGRLMPARLLPSSIQRRHASTACSAFPAPSSVTLASSTTTVPHGDDGAVALMSRRRHQDGFSAAAAMDEQLAKVEEQRRMQSGGSRWNEPAAAAVRNERRIRNTRQLMGVALRNWDRRQHFVGAAAATRRASPMLHCRPFSTGSATTRSVLSVSVGMDSKQDYVLPPPAPPPMNHVQVPLISNHLRSQIFPSIDSPFAPPPPSTSAIAVSLAHLKSHGLLAPPPASSKGVGEIAKPPKPIAAAVDFVLPQLQGPTLAHHFQTLAHHTAEPYLSLSKSFAAFSLAPQPDPQTWILNPGWTHYAPDGSWSAIAVPGDAERGGDGMEDQAMVFDVETLPYAGGDYPVMAVAAGRKGWYAWCSPWLTGDSESPNHLIPFTRADLHAASLPPASSPSASTSIPSLSASSSSSSALPFPESSSLFERPSDLPLLLIGHNVLFDRARVGTEYALRRPSTRWLDTQSLHIATAGLTNPQRPAWMMHRKELKEQAAMEEKKKQQDAQVDLAIDSETFGEESPSNILLTEADNVTEKASTASRNTSTLPGSTTKTIPPAPPKAKRWQEVSSMNSLVEVARLHCGIEVDKSLRNVFIDPATTISDVRDNFEALVGYCATDVQITHSVYRVVLPKFLDLCPHPASFSGILLMSQPVLPVDYKWPEYLERAQEEYEKRLDGVKKSLHSLAEEARKLMGKMGEDGKWEWEKDLWLRQLDWSPRRVRRLPSKVGSTELLDSISAPPLAAPASSILPSIPHWYATIQQKHNSVIPFDSPLAAVLLRTTWRSFPTYFSHAKGWLFAVPARKKFAAAPREELIDVDDLAEKDYAIRSLKGVKLWSIPSAGRGRCLKLLSQRHLDMEAIGSEFEEMQRGIKLGSGGSETEWSAISEKLESLARKAIAGGNTSEGENGIWLRQLDWTRADPIRLDNGNTLSTRIESRNVQSSDLVWPQWYYDLDKPGIGLDISIGKRAAPLLLKLQWKGNPICYSKQFGWTFRVSNENVEAVLQADAALSPLEFDDVADASLSDDNAAIYVRLPHADGDEKNVGSPLSKSFLGAFDTGVLSSEYPAAAAALAMNASCSYWASAKVRILNQMVVWEGDAARLPPTPDSPTTQGLILPQVLPMGTVTRRAVERTWLTASNAKKNRVGSELKSMIRAPPGYAIVGADVDSEELWICSVMGDAQFGIHGATAIGWMTLEGTKSAGTDLHSKSASILGISRDDAKVFNYSRIYGAGVKHAVQLLLKSNPKLTKEQATQLAKNLYASTKGLTSRSGFDREFWHGGTESFVFNKLEQIAQSDRPRTPALGCGITDALTKEYLPKKGRDTYLPSRINWVVQSSGVDYLHLLLVSMEYLTRRFSIDARYMISVHDEIRYLVKEEDKYRLAMALQISNLWTRALFSYRLQMSDLPQSCAFFSAVDLDHCFRKEVNMTCLTPSNPDSIPFGESLDIAGSLATTSNGSLFADGRSMQDESSTLPTISAPTIYEDPLPSVDQQHRVSETNFLRAQTETKPAVIRKLWDESRGISPQAKRGASSRDQSTNGLSWDEISSSTVVSVRKPGLTSNLALKHAYIKRYAAAKAKSGSAQSSLSKRVLAEIGFAASASLVSPLTMAKTKAANHPLYKPLIRTVPAAKRSMAVDDDDDEDEAIPDELMRENFSGFGFESLKRPDV